MPLWPLLRSKPSPRRWVRSETIKCHALAQCVSWFYYLLCCVQVYPDLHWPRQRRLTLARRLWSLRNKCNHSRGRPACGAPVSWIRRFGAPHAGLPLRWIAWLRYFLKDHQRREGVAIIFASRQRRLNSIVADATRRALRDSPMG